jgi:hypothetical protein
MGQAIKNRFKKTQTPKSKALQDVHDTGGMISLVCSAFPKVKKNKKKQKTKTEAFAVDVVQGGGHAHSNERNVAASGKGSQAVHRTRISASLNSSRRI